ncbi:MAG: sugar transferase [Bacteroidales bacterium]|jgi:lipopolysaccharide/colanic/teichoic acid biosynthesis glycosyltransferase|nr:sugar transferase [Bacteroidales bacterium]
MIRFFDFLFSLFGLVILTPILLVISFLVFCTTGGPVFYKQIRVGKNNKDFVLYKFRTMNTGSDRKSLLTVGDKDSRITNIGRFLRKHKLDELSQLWNVLKGDMSLVGPRPEVRKYVNLYNEEQKRVLNVRPGITDYASIAFVDENRILALSKDPEKEYIETILPKKLELNLRYIENRSVREYFKILLLTQKSIFRIRVNSPSPILRETNHF